MVTDFIYLINDIISEGKKVLIEGANALILDFDLGEYEYFEHLTKFTSNEKYIQWNLCTMDTLAPLISVLILRCPDFPGLVIYKANF